MAKYGEGDKRWIVEDRPDGANVHNWHWAETDCLEWSRSLLSNLLSNLVILDGEGNLFIKIKKIEKVDGEAYVNVRRVDGSVEIPYISDENADEDPEIKVTIKDEGPVGKRLKEAMVAKGKPVIEEKIRIYVQSMAKGGPAKDELEAKKVAPKGQSTAVKEAEADSATPAAGEKKEVKKESSKGFKKETNKGLKL
ncbi:hypothetical protein GH714_031447 [Hevea brasiliensis]|uniref:Activator of Hsp90 ATPase AHSA1-like N-terminal domain-containing protein n=1 Tax=Hevea brasiliensis TaxID=3981 RepID=A0A6A6M5D4_HEVBR|nr:hypothetical protein GH714_031447 [Hevea brasiliensis]